MNSTLALDIAQIKAMLQPPIKRDNIISLIACGRNMPKMMRTASYIALQGMKQADLDNIGVLAKTAVELMESNNEAGLDAFLASHNIPPQIAALIKNYAKNFITQ